MNHLLYEGKAKQMYETDNKDLLLVKYMDQATALNGLKKDQVVGKGKMNNEITSLIFERLSAVGITNHFIKKLSKDEQLVKRVEMLPLEVVVRNVAAGSFSKRLGIPEGDLLAFPIVEFYYKADALDDPFINDQHVLLLSIASVDEIARIKEIALQVNKALQELFTESHILLVDFKIEIGKLPSGELILADEISPDTCRLWDATSKEHLDKDVYRRDLGDLIPVYQEVLDRLEKRRD